jgi:putative ABC transport system substrate-binding protein
LGRTELIAGGTATSFRHRGRLAAPVHDRSELESAFAAQAREPNGSLVVLPDSFLNAHSLEVTSLAARYRLPAVYPYRLYVKAGGLLAYGNDVFENYRRAAGYVDRILKGEKPSELPVQAPVKFELAVNLKTAMALGLEIPPTLLARAECFRTIAIRRRRRAQHRTGPPKE